MTDKRMARPDRAARRGHLGYALCGWCNCRLAYLWYFWTLVEVSDPNTTGRRFHQTILLHADWTLHDDGIWRRTSHTYGGKPSLRRLHKAVPQQSRVWKSRHSTEHEIVVVRHPTRSPVVCKCGTCGELQILDPATLGVSLYFSVAEGEEDIHWGLPPEYDEQLREGISQLRHDIEKIFGPTAQMNAKGGQLLYLVLADDGEGGKIPILLLDEPMRSYLKAGD